MSRLSSSRNEVVTSCQGNLPPKMHSESCSLQNLTLRLTERSSSRDRSRDHSRSHRQPAPGTRIECRSVDRWGGRSGDRVV